ncbi:hypothetical protein C8R47DRAFT_1160495 [Mycena vitilis]|nr:hypothetical protein C8R47DRAFT_1160495 [Mycena vitilis]
MQWPFGVFVRETATFTCAGCLLSKYCFACEHLKSPEDTHGRILPERMPKTALEKHSQEPVPPIRSRQKIVDSFCQVSRARNNQ